MCDMISTFSVMHTTHNFCPGLYGLKFWYNLALDVFFLFVTELHFNGCMFICLPQVYNFNSWSPKLCGSSPPPPFYSVAGDMYVFFFSGDWSEYGDFAARFESVSLSEAKRHSE